MHRYSIEFLSNTKCGKRSWIFGEDMKLWNIFLQRLYEDSQIWTSEIKQNERNNYYHEMIIEEK